MDYFKVTKRCIRCRKPLRSDGTCQNVKCVRYKPEPTAEEKAEAEKVEASAALVHHRLDELQERVK